MAKKLSPSMQDYLEAILDLSSTDDEVRITDIANRLSLSKASTNQAIGGLVERGMVTHRHYGPVALTESGREEARKIRYRHDVLKSFLTNALGVESKIAEQDACLMEHTISQETLTRLVEFMEKHTCDKEGIEMPVMTDIRLSNLPVGGKAIVKKIDSTGSIKKRILEMGLTVGTVVEIKGTAPMGDPIDVGVKGYHLSLRKKEASLVLVDPV